MHGSIDCLNYATISRNRITYSPHLSRKFVEEIDRDSKSKMVESKVSRRTGFRISHLKVMTNMQQVNNVLLIDDDHIFNMINERVIQMAKFSPSVKSYLGAAHAIDELKLLVKNNPNEFPDVIFLDINMPDMDGWDFLEEFKKFSEDLLQKCKVILLSSSIDSKDVERSKKYKIVYDVIPKPLSTSKLKLLYSKPNEYSVT